MGNDTDGRDFERELRDLVLTAFADGEEVSGARELTTVPDRIPDWHVTIERRDGEERPGETERRGGKEQRDGKEQRNEEEEAVGLGRTVGESP